MTIQKEIFELYDDPVEVDYQVLNTGEIDIKLINGDIPEFHLEGFVEEVKDALTVVLSYGDCPDHLEHTAMMESADG